MERTKPDSSAKFVCYTLGDTHFACSFIFILYLLLSRAWMQIVTRLNWHKSAQWALNLCGLKWVKDKTKTRGLLVFCLSSKNSVKCKAMLQSFKMTKQTWIQDDSTDHWAVASQKNKQPRSDSYYRYLYWHCITDVLEPRQVIMIWELKWFVMSKCRTIIRIITRENITSSFSNDSSGK